ncbi:MAG: DUF1570 domain-containing protein [Pirellulales bacterium]
MRAETDNLMPGSGLRDRRYSLREGGCQPLRSGFSLVVGLVVCWTLAIGGTSGQAWAETAERPAEATERQAEPAHEADESLCRIKFHLDGQDHDVTGRVLVQAQDGGVLLEGRDGTLWPVTGEQVKSREPVTGKFEYYSAKELSEKLLEEVPEGFRIHQTAHYVICYNTSRAYAQWCGALFERLYRSFGSFFENREHKLRTPPPLVALVFQDQKSYEEYGRPEVKEGIQTIIGYYSLRTNRIATYDLTGLGNRDDGANGALMQRINQLLDDPRAERTVATLIHEATHQLAFNCGLQTRFADVPLWYNEGMAMFFETPDPRNRRGWRSVGGVNYTRLGQFRDHLKGRSADSLVTLLIDDHRLRDSNQAEVGYAESWALCYFLIKTRKQQFIEYSHMLSAKRPLEKVTADERLREFQQIFGTDLAALDAEFLRFMEKVK